MYGGSTNDTVETTAKTAIAAGVRATMTLRATERLGRSTGTLYGAAPILTIAMLLIERGGSTLPSAVVTPAFSNVNQR
jgi:hypothetical protein